MGFMILIIGIAGLAGAIELDSSPTVSILVTILGLVLLAMDYRKYLIEQHRR